MNNLQQTASRREFLRSSTRYGVLSILGALTVANARKNRLQDCVNQGVCGGCPAFVTCELPTAAGVKRARKGD